MSRGNVVTRINTCNVKELSDPHLKGEYKEISRVFTNTIKCIHTHGVDKALEYIKNHQPLQYTVRTEDNPKGGRGHEMFFRDKLGYIEERYVELGLEMERRGNNVNWGMIESVLDDARKIIVDSRFWKDYIPTPEAYELNLKRRIEMGHKETNYVFRIW